MSGASALRIDAAAGTLTGPGLALKLGDIITLDGSTGLPCPRRSNCSADIWVETLLPEHPTICVGEPGVCVTGRPVLRATAGGWSAGVVEGDQTPLIEQDSFVPAGIAAGGIAVSEAFEFLRRRLMVQAEAMYEEWPMVA